MTASATTTRPVASQEALTQRADPSDAEQAALVEEMRAHLKKVGLLLSLCHFTRRIASVSLVSRVQDAASAAPI